MQPGTASSDSAPPALQQRPKAMLLGLPCAHCKVYFAADLEVCPICGCKQRVVIGKRAANVVVVRSGSSVSAGSARLNLSRTDAWPSCSDAGLALASEKGQCSYSARVFGAERANSGANSLARSAPLFHCGTRKVAEWQGQLCSTPFDQHAAIA